MKKITVIILASLISIQLFGETERKDAQIGQKREVILLSSSYLSKFLRSAFEASASVLKFLAQVSKLKLIS